MRIVLDTNILVRTTPRSTGPAREVLALIRTGGHVLVLSEFILAELERALQYPRVGALFAPPLTLDEIQSFIADLRGVNPEDIQDVGSGATAPVVSADPDDNPVIQTAVDGRADVLCSLDRHLRRSLKVKAYCASHDITLATDVELLSVLRGGR